MPVVTVVKNCPPMIAHDKIGESWRLKLDLKRVKVGFGATRFKRRSAVVAKSNWKVRSDASSLTVSRDTCNIFAEVGKVDI